MTSEAAVAQVDIVVGLTSYNDAATVAAVAAAVQDGLARHFAGAASRFVLADCGSTDDTRGRARDSLSGTDDILEVPSAPTTTICWSCPITAFRERLVRCTAS